MSAGPMLLGATQVVFEGVPTYPDAGRAWAITDKYKVRQTSTRCTSGARAPISLPCATHTREACTAQAGQPWPVQGELLPPLSCPNMAPRGTTHYQWPVQSKLRGLGHQGQVPDELLHTAGWGQSCVDPRGGWPDMHNQWPACSRVQGCLRRQGPLRGLQGEAAAPPLLLACAAQAPHLHP